AAHLATGAAVDGAAGERRLLEAGRADRRLGDAGADARVVRGRVGDPAHLVRAPGGGVAGLVDRALGGGVRVGAGPAAAVAEVVDRVGALRQDAVLPVVGVNGGITRLRVAEDDQAALGAEPGVAGRLGVDIALGVDVAFDEGRLVLVRREALREQGEAEGLAGRAVVRGRERGLGARGVSDDAGACV